MMFHYTMCGLDYVWLRNGYRRRETDYGQGVSIERADELDRAVAASVIESPARLRGQEIRFLRALLRRSQAELAFHLGVKRLTVARWEGAPETPIPGPADRLLRLFAARALLGPQTIEPVLDLLAEIGDERPSRLEMTYVPDEAAPEPPLFPEIGPDGEGWRPARAA